VLGVGDWLFFENMGAYTKCSATRFNGFTDDHEVIYISSEVGATALLQHSRDTFIAQENFPSSEPSYEEADTETLSLIKLAVSIPRNLHSFGPI